MLGQDVLHLERVDVVPAADVHVRGTSHQDEIAVVVQAPQVAAEQSALGVEYLTRRGGVAPVAAHHAGSLDPDPPHLAGRDDVTARIHQIDARLGLGLADGAVLDLGRIVRRRPA